MPTAIDLRAIWIANIIGIAVLFSVARGHYWRLKNPTRESRIMLVMFLVCFFSCIVDPLGFWADGRAGALSTFLIWMSSIWTYAANLLIALCFHALVTCHLGIPLHRIHKTILAVPTILLMTLLVVNFFVPVVFSIQENVYQRTELYWLYLGIEGAISLDALALYWYVRRSSGKLKFFPANSFVLPAVIGIFIQSAGYGVSTIFPFYAVSFGFVATALQNEYIFRDRLTGLYNRFFFTTLQKKLAKASDRSYIVMMLDVNGFKSINDTYGHNVGDRALIEVSEVLQGVVREKGLAIRYAGDEFIMILFNAGEPEAKKAISEVRAALDQRNRTAGNPYRLSLAIGYCQVSLQDRSINELVDEVDKRMYEDKRAHYSRKEPTVPPEQRQE